MTSANLLRPVTAADLMATGLRSQQAVPLRSEDCAGCHDSGPRVGKRQPGVPTGIPGVTAPREYRQLVESGELAQMMMPSPAPRDVRFWRRLGFTALTIGLVLIGLIVYAMLFAYR